MRRYVLRCQTVAAALIATLTFKPVHVVAQAPELTPRNLLTTRYDVTTLAENLVPQGEWHPIPRIADREQWESVPPAVAAAHVAAAESLMGMPWESMPATLFLEFVRTGNRSNYQRISFGRRERLATLVIAELLENRGRFLDDIVDGIWIISEETFWGIPAHLDLQTAGFGLPDANEPAVDLFAAETGALLSWTLYLLGDRLDTVSPLVAERIRSEVQRRIIEPTRTRTDFWWMGFDPTVINNWTPWVGSNWLAALLLIEDDPQKRAVDVHKVLQILDIFLNSYPDDGGCDEGPGYWNRAGGSLLDALEILYGATGGHVSIYDEELVRSMARFIYRTHVAGPYFVNFADASPRATPDPAVMLVFGRRIGDDRLQGFAGLMARRMRLKDGFVSERFGSVFRQIRRLMLIDDLYDIEPREPLLSEVWLPDTEIMTARVEEGSERGLYLAAKAGHNGENHNHNDVGNFIVYESGRPVLIDVGPGTYTRTTFSDDRYTVWNFQSDYHNVPTINGMMQHDGRAFSSSDVTYASESGRTVLGMNLEKAYPDSADVLSWRRMLEFDRTSGTITVDDRYHLRAVRQSPRINLMTALEVEETEPGVVRLKQDRYDDVLVTFEPDLMTASIEAIELDDPPLRNRWGERLYRIMLQARRHEAGGRLVIAIRRGDP